MTRYRVIGSPWDASVVAPNEVEVEEDGRALAHYENDASQLYDTLPRLLRAHTMTTLDLEEIK